VAGKVNITAVHIVIDLHQELFRIWKECRLNLCITWLISTITRHFRTDRLPRSILVTQLTNRKWRIIPPPLHSVTNVK
jgi:hypothetical protein